MRLKLFFVPIVVILILVLLILYIKPDYAVIKVKKSEIAFKDAQVANMDAVISSINSLEQDLNGQAESEKLVNVFLPRDLDSERVVDAFNFIAEQTGVILATIDIAQPKENATPLFPVAEAGPLTSVNPGFGSPDEVGIMESSVSVMPEGPAPPAETTQAVIRIGIEGSYANVKRFMERVSHLDRANSFRSVTIEEKPMEVEGINVSDPNDPLLSSNFEIWMDYAASKKVDTALSVQTFRSSQYDRAPVEKLNAWITNPLPALQVTPGGKTNPFQE